MAAKKAEETPTEDPKKEDGQQTPDWEAKFKELDSKYGQLTNQFGELDKITKGMEQVVTTIAGDEALKRQFQETYAKSHGVSTPDKQEQVKDEAGKTPSNPSTTPTSDKRVDDVVAANRERIILDFESKYGIDKMKDEDKKSAREAVGKYLNDFGWSVGEMPLSTLPQALERAFVGTHAEKLRDEGKLEGMAIARNNANATMGTFNGQAIQESHEPGLTSDQKKWSEKLGVDPEKAKKTYLDKDNEEKRVSLAEQKAEAYKTGKTE